MSQDLKVPKGEIRGTGVVRDKDGNIKGYLSLVGSGTPEQFDALQKSLNKEGAAGGDHPVHSRS